MNYYWTDVGWEWNWPFHIWIESWEPHEQAENPRSSENGASSERSVFAYVYAVIVQIIWWIVAIIIKLIYWY